MRWGTSLGEASRGDVEALANAGLGVAERALVVARWLRPIPLVIDFAGKITVLDLDASSIARRTPEALTSAAIHLLAQHAPQARAVALVTGSRLTADRVDAIEVWVEHRDGDALTVLRPFRRAGGRLRLLAPRAYQGSRLIWARTRAA
ncbi:MAG TPA: hypothetical protein VNQ48_02870 [Microbacteriaceae bacterium]|nr:hypothetical protein [Microbacteriaceae bacterium]